MAAWDVFNELETLRREIDEAFRGMGFGRPVGPTFLSPVASRRFPLVNFSEDEGNVYIEALVPGVAPNNVELSVLRNTVP
jgi:HSP20 family protein